MGRARWVWLWAAALAAGCGAGGLWPEVVGPRDVPSADGGPRVRRVRDLGDLEALPAAGLALAAPDPDGVFVVGELVLIEGSDFGRLPTVLVGGRPAGVLARTSGGGIVTRIPDGVPAGPVAVEVSHPRGRHALDIPVRRYGLVAQSDGDRIFVVDVGKAGARVEPKPLVVQNPRYVRFSTDGSMAYVASGVSEGAESAKATGKLSVVAMSAGGGPRVIGEIPVASRFVVSLAVAEREPLLAVVGEAELHLFSLIDPRHPAPYDPFPLPPEIARAGVVAADLEPGGKILALLLGDGNRLASFDVSAPARPVLVTTVDLLPGERLPLVRDMRFSGDGETLWVVSGDNVMSVGAGKQPTRLTAVSLRPGADPAEKPVVAVWRTAAVNGATAPLRLTVARGQPIASGTTIRTPPEKAAVFVTGVDARLFALAGLDLFKAAGRERAVGVLRPIAQPGMLVRTNVDGGGGPLFTVPSILSSVDLSPDSQVLLATTCLIRTEGGAKGLALEFGLTVTPLWGDIRPHFVKLADMKVDAFRPPFSIGHVRIQP